VFEIEKIKSSEGKDLFSSDIHYLPEVDSTNKYAKSLSGEGDSLILTDNQTRGLGRMGRIWKSEKGKNLTFTLIKHFDIDSENIQAVNYYFSYFLLACLKDYTAKNINKPENFPEFEIKWPNDILADNKKISGLLIENLIDKKRFLVGIGLNVNQEKFPGELEDNTTSLKKIIERDIDLNDLIIELLNVYAENINLISKKKYKMIYKLWKDSSSVIGKKVEYQDIQNKHNIGKIIDLLYDGGLKMKVNGEFKTFYSGDIKLLPKLTEPVKE
jgi:BirA family biotin operon repressor/biotin-[acetyl-CoA-carboxylase] ligase